MADNMFSDLARVIDQVGKDKGIDRAVVIDLDGLAALQQGGAGHLAVRAVELLMCCGCRSIHARQFSRCRLREAGRHGVLNS